MAKWEFEKSREGNRIRILLLRDSGNVGRVSGVITKSAGGLKYFLGMGIWVSGKYQQEYMKTHKGIKMGEDLGLNLLESLKREGISYISLGWRPPRGTRFVERTINSGILEKTPDGQLFKINWGKLPATEDARMGMVRKLRAGEATKKLKSIPRKPRRTRAR